MSTGVQTMPVLALLPQADFVNGDAGMKMTTNLAWDKKTITAGEIATIIPVPQNVLDDADYDIWGEARGPIEEAIARVVDRATLAVANPKAPANWPVPIVPAAIAAGNIAIEGNGVDLAADISNMFAILEEDEYEVSGLAGMRRLKTSLRNMRTTTNEPLYTPLTGNTPAMIYGVPTQFVGRGVWEGEQALALAADWSNIVYAMRKDMTFQIFDTGVISDDDGKIVYNLLQQDMVAMRVVMRFGWQVANPIDIDRVEVGKTYYPAAVLQPSSGKLEALTVVSAAGTAVGDTKLTVTPALVVGNSYVYQTGAALTAPKYDDATDTGWTEWDGKADITATTDQKIGVAEVNAAGEVRKYGEATVVSKA
jgi:hypothetical protein